MKRFSIISYLVLVGSVALGGCLNQSTPGDVGEDDGEVRAAHVVGVEATDSQRTHSGEPQRLGELEGVVHPASGIDLGPRPEPWHDEDGPRPEPWQGGGRNPDPDPDPDGKSPSSSK